jgi:nucleotide-binding universal stress UspA family protein
MKNNITKMEDPSPIKIPEKKASNEKHFLALLNITSEVEPIMEIATALAGLYKGRITAENFVALPPQTPLEVGLRYAEGPSKNLRIASQYHSQNQSVDCLLLISHNRRLAILNTTREKNIDFVIGGFQGCMDIYKNLRNALSKIPTDTLILRPLSNKKMGNCSRILVPLLNGPHTPLALEIACDLAKTFGQKLAILHEYEPRIYKESLEQVLNRLEAKPDSIPLERITDGQNSIISSILKEVKEDTWLILPAYRPSWWARLRPRCKQRSLLKEIIQCSDAPIMIVKKHERRIGFFQKILKQEWN